MASTALATPALARDGEWYIAGEGGVMLVEDASVNDGAATVGHEEGYDFGAAVGYDFGAFRLETEASYKEADLEDISSTNAVGEANFLSFMLNGLFDFGPDDGMQGFLGAGIGVARSDLTGAIEVPNQGPFDRVYNDSDTGLAWQLLAGVRAPLTDKWDVGLKYRYFTADGIGIVGFDGSPLETKVSTHSILGTLTYNFGKEAPPPPPPPPPSAAPPPPPPPTIKYSTFPDPLTTKLPGFVNT